MTEGLVRSVAMRDKLKMKLLRNPSDALKSEFKKYRNELTDLIRITENKYYRDKLNENSNNCKGTWQIISEIYNCYNKHTKIDR